MGTGFLAASRADKRTQVKHIFINNDAHQIPIDNILNALASMGIFSSTKDPITLAANREIAPECSLTENIL